VVEFARTYIVECFLPDVDDHAVQQSADAAAAATRFVDMGAGGVEYLGALMIAVDEVVLHAFRASDLELVRQASAAAGISYARIVESVEIAAVGSGPFDAHT
jgi:hypothetical protein